MSKEEQGKKMGQIIAKAWADETFKKSLLADAAAVLKEEGVAMPAGLAVKAVENTESVFHLVIPAKPKQDLSEAELDAVAGGGCNLDVCFQGMESGDLTKYAKQACGSKACTQNGEVSVPQ